MRRILPYLLILSGICLSSCGGGGESPLAAAKATVTYSTSLAAGRTDSFGSIEFTADLPPGVTVRASNGVIDNGNLVVVGKALEVSSKAFLGTYVPALRQNLHRTSRIRFTDPVLRANTTSHYP